MPSQKTWSKVLLVLFIILTVTSVGFTYYKTVYTWDFVIVNDLDENTE